MPAALIVARAVQFWAVATMLGGGGLALLSPRLRGAVLLLRLGAVAAAASGAAWLILTLVGVTDDTGSVVRLDDWQAFFGASFGPPWAIRVALLAACLAVLPSRRPGPYLAVAAALVVDQAWLGHAAAGVGLAGVAMIASYWAHVLAGFAWVGALVMLAATLRERTGGEIAASLALFSRAGVFLVATILVSGAVNASFRLAAIGELASTSYGLLVLLKLVLLCAMACLAIVNRQDVNRQAMSRRPGEMARALRLRIVAETCLGLAVLAVAAVLGVTPPPG